MSSADFAAAQARLAARRQQRETEVRARHAQLLESRSVSMTRIPFPFRSIGHAGSSVWSAISGREGTRPAFRVGQVDAELLDEELLELLRAQVEEALKYYGAQLSNEYSAEILVALRAILFKLTLWDHDASYGAALQGLRYMDAREKSLTRPPPKRWQKAIYGLITVFGRYGWEKWEQYLVDVEGGFDEPSPLLRRLSSITTGLDTTYSLAALVSFLTFLYNGTYRTLLDRVLRLRLVPKSSHTSREVSFEYLNRQLVWHAFTEFLLFLLPLVGISRWRRIIGRTWRRLKNRLVGTGKASNEEDLSADGELGFLPHRTCAICYAEQYPTIGAGEAEIMAASISGSGGVIGSAQTDITNPYEAMPCGDVYCFVCLAQKIEAEEGEGWTCLRCGEIIKECKPWHGDTLEESSSSRPTSGTGVKSVGFATGGNGADKVRDEECRSAVMESVDPEPIEEEDETHEMGESYGHSIRSPFSVPDNSTLLNDSGQWANQSNLINGDGKTASDAEDGSENDYSDRSSDDQQSEEYDEEEYLDVTE